MQRSPAFRRVFAQRLEILLRRHLLPRLAEAQIRETLEWGLTYSEQVKWVDGLRAANQVYQDWMGGVGGARFGLTDSGRKHLASLDLRVNKEDPSGTRGLPGRDGEDRAVLSNIAAHGTVANMLRQLPEEIGAAIRASVRRLVEADLVEVL